MNERAVVTGLATLFAVVALVGVVLSGGPAVPGEQPPVATTGDQGADDATSETTTSVSGTGGSDDGETGGEPATDGSTRSTSEPSTTVEESTEATTTVTGTTETTATETTTTSSEPTYQYTIDDIQECGTTCRDVTVTLTNNRETARTGVVVEITISADGEVVWEGTEEIGELGPGGSVTRTRRVDVGFSGGLAIRNNDGYVTIETTVRSDGGTVTYEQRRKVA